MLIKSTGSILARLMIDLRPSQVIITSTNQNHRYLSSSERPSSMIKCQILNNHQYHAPFATNVNSITTSSVLLSLASSVKSDESSSSSSNQQTTKKDTKTNDPNRKPTQEQLIQVKDTLTTLFPKFIKERHPFHIYTKDVIFENFYDEPAKTTIGTAAYGVQLAYLKLKINVVLSQVQLNILNITHDVNDGTVKVRWRLSGMRGALLFFKTLNVKLWNKKESISDKAEWHDGFSIFYVRGDSLIYKHRMQRVQPQHDEEEVKAKLEKLKKLANLAT